MTTDRPNWVRFMPTLGLNCAQNTMGVAVEANWVRFMPALGLNCAQNAVGGDA